MATPELPQGVHDGQEEPQDLRMAVLDSLEAVLRVPEGAPLDPDLLSTLVSQVQELLVRPVHGAQLPSTDQELQLCRVDADLWKQQAERCQQELTDKCAENDDLRRQIDSLKASASTQALEAAHAQKLALIREQQASLQKDNEDLRHRCAAAQQEITNLRVQADTADSRAVGLQARLRECESELTATRAACTSAQTAHQSASASLMDAEQVIQELERQLMVAQQSASVAPVRIREPSPQLPSVAAPNATSARAEQSCPPRPPPTAHTVDSPRAKADLLLIQAELEGSRQSNRLLTQRLMQLETVTTAGQAGSATSPRGLPTQPSHAEHVLLQSEVEGLRQTVQQLRRDLIASTHTVASLEASYATCESERDSLKVRLAAAERRAADAEKEQVLRTNQAAEAHVQHIATEQGALAGVLADARRRLANSSLALEHEVGTWRLATSQAVQVAEAAQSKVAALDKQLLDTESRLRSRTAEYETRGVEIAELKIQLEEAKTVLEKKTALLDKLDSHLLRPLCAWYSTTGYPTLVKADTHTINPNNPHHPLHPTQPTNTAATATIPVSRTRASSPAGAVRSAGAGARPRTAPSARPAGRAAATPATSLLASVRASWPEPVPVVASAQEGGVVGVGGVVKPSKEFVRLQERVRRVLGDGAVLCVDSQADRRLEVAVAAQELLQLWVDKLQGDLQSLAQDACAAAIAAAEAAQKRLDDLKQSHAEELGRAQEDTQVQAHLAREAREATALAQRELAAAVRDLVTEREASARLHEQLQATDNELRRREGERSAEREEMQARIEELIHEHSIALQRAQEGAHSVGVEEGQRSMEPTLDQLRAEVHAVSQELCVSREQCENLLQRVQELEGELVHKEEQLIQSVREVTRDLTAREHEWQQRERQIHADYKARLEQTTRESAQALEDEKARCRVLVDEEYRSGLAKLEQAACQWEQQRSVLESELQERAEDNTRQAVAEAVRETRRAMEQEYTLRDSELRSAQEAALASLASRADTTSAAWRAKETELQKELDTVEGELRACRRELSEVKTALTGALADRAQLVKDKEDTVSAFEVKVSEYRSRLLSLESAQEGLRARQQEQAREHEAALARLQQRIRALSEERGLWEEQTARLQASVLQHKEVAEAAQEAGDRAWAAAHAASAALQEAKAEAKAREAQYKEQVRALESKYKAQLAAAATQLSAVRAKQQALTAGVMNVLAERQNEAHPY